MCLCYQCLLYMYICHFCRLQINHTIMLQLKIKPVGEGAWRYPAYAFRACWMLLRQTGSEFSKPREQSFPSTISSGACQYFASSISSMLTTLYLIGSLTCSLPFEVLETVAILEFRLRVSKYVGLSVNALDNDTEDVWPLVAPVGTSSSGCLTKS